MRETSFRGWGRWHGCFYLSDIPLRWYEISIARESAAASVPRRQRMNIHEYQAKELFDRFEVPSPRGQMAETAEEALKIAQEINSDLMVVKAQVHAGGRGKGTFKNGFEGGVHLTKSAEDIGAIAGKMIGQTLVTKQTGEEGKLVRKVMVADAVDIKHEYYLAVLMDRETSRPVIVASTEGGMDIEEVAESSPEKILRVFIHPLAGLQAHQVRKLIVVLD